MDIKIKTTTEQIAKLWSQVPELSLGHLIALAVKEDVNLYQISDQDLIRNISLFVAAMENQKNLRK